MSGSRSKAEKEREKANQDRCLQILSQMLKDEDNKYCVDCDSKGPRWSSWNIGVFLCIRCAGIHRNLGVHISKVKSVNLDSWTPQQVASLQHMGNSKGRAVYEANLPDDFRRPSSDSSMEAFIRNKYEKKKFIAKEWVQTKPPDYPVGWNDLVEQEKLAKARDLGGLRKATGMPEGVNAGSNQTAAKSPQPTAAKVAASSPAAASVASVTNNTIKVTESKGAVSSPAPTKATSGTSDLLGLSLGSNNTASNSSASALEDDLLGFSAFITAPAVSSSTAPTATPQNSGSTNGAGNKDEADFFNQVSSNSGGGSSTTSTGGDANKMSKDSILALFGKNGGTGGGGSGTSGSAAPMFAAGFPPQLAGQQMPFGQNPTQQQQQQTPFFPNTGASQFPVGSGLNPSLGLAQQNGFMPMPQQQQQQATAFHNQPQLSGFSSQQQMPGFGVQSGGPFTSNSNNNNFVLNSQMSGGFTQARMATPSSTGLYNMPGQSVGGLMNPAAPAAGVPPNMMMGLMTPQQAAPVPGLANNPFGDLGQVNLPQKANQLSQQLAGLNFGSGAGNTHNQTPATPSLWQ